MIELILGVKRLLHLIGRVLSVVSLTFETNHSCCDCHLTQGERKDLVESDLWQALNRKQTSVLKHRNPIN
jgi:hypothetical protein